MPVLPTAQYLRDPATRHEAFALLVKETAPRLYSVVRKMVRWHDDADDVLQNTYLKAWQVLDNYRGDAQPATWLYRIAMNESITFLERQKETKRIEDDDLVRALEADPYFDGDETERQLQQAINTLPEKQRIVFNLKYYEQMKYEEMSQLLSTSVGALKASYHLAVKKIEAFFAQLD